jgi:uncharacterized protein with LGFP repeats
MESERLMHPVINQIGGHPKRSHKRGKSSRYDNRPYGKVINGGENMFTNHPYRWSTIAPWNILTHCHFGRFQGIQQKFYIPIMPY